MFRLHVESRWENCLKGSIASWLKECDNNEILNILVGACRKHKQKVKVIQLREEMQHMCVRVYVSFYFNWRDGPAYVSLIEQVLGDFKLIAWKIPQNWLPCRNEFFGSYWMMHVSI